MTRFEYLRSASIAPVIILVGSTILAFTGQRAMALPVAYSWRGTMTPLEANVDPWDIGSVKPFTITVLVNQDAVDLDASLVVARFDLLDAELLIDGVPQQSFDRGVILIEDRDFRDSLSIILFDVQFNGVRERFFAGASLPTATLTFARPFESPPFFSATETISRGGAESENSSYSTFSGLNTTVTATVIPEPSTFVLSLLAIIYVGIPFRRKRNR